MSPDKTAEDVIARSISIVCSDGNSDPARVAANVVKALKSAGWMLVKPTWHPAANAAQSRESPLDWEASNG